ncbi:MAG TPA: hypothetical protein VNG13_14610 [Mycobacteriales bacterium]|nr:hypothetical protein [Mycobacteriales bacterium]
MPGGGGPDRRRWRGVLEAQRGELAQQGGRVGEIGPDRAALRFGLRLRFRVGDQGCYLRLGDRRERCGELGEDFGDGPARR